MSDSVFPFILLIIVGLGLLTLGGGASTAPAQIGILVTGAPAATQNTLQLNTIPFIAVTATPVPLPPPLLSITPFTPGLTQNPLPNVTGTTEKTLTSWPVFNLDGQRSGINTVENLLTAQTVKNLKTIWKVKLPDTADSSPVAQAKVVTPTGTKDLVFVTTLKGSLVALDAATGGIVWQKNGVGGGDRITNSSPAIDSSGQFIYSYNLDGKVHKFMITTGAEITTGGWPEVGTTMVEAEKESSALNIDNGYLYVTFSGYNGDGGHYEGHVDAINLATGTKTVWNSLCANIKTQLTQADCNIVQSGIWARAGAVADPITHTIDVVTGNGAYDANVGGNNYGDSIIALSPDLGKIMDSYTPASYTSLQANDADLGSTAPVLIPQQQNTNTPSLLLQGGKDNMLRLVNRQNMSGKGTPNNVAGELQSLGIGCKLFSQPLAWTASTGTTWVFVSAGCGLYAYKVVNAAGKSSLQLAYQGVGGSSPVMANNILYIQSANSIRAIDPTTGTVLWTGTTQGLHWESPIVFNGVVFVPDDSGNLTAFGL